jgi:hypothetical protein
MESEPMTQKWILGGLTLFALGGALCPRLFAQHETALVELREARHHAPKGIYVLNEASNEQSTATAYAAGLTSSAAYLDDVDGHAIFVPLAQILPSVTTWGTFTWDWTYLDTLIGVAVSNHKKFSIALEIGFQSSTTFQQSLPLGFAAACGADCAPLFDVWAVGGTGGRCISAYIPLPWNANVQQMWRSAAHALAQHLRQMGVYRDLTMIHVPGLSVYDEELRLPTGTPAPASGDTTVCPDGRLATTAVAADASQANWQSLGYSDAAVIGGFGKITHAFARAFPDRFLGLSLFNPGSKGIDFPNFTNDPVGYVASQIVQEVTAIAPGRVQLQSDDIDTNFVLPEVVNFAAQYNTFIGWQTNKHAGTGAACSGSPCVDLGQTGTPYFDIIQEGAQNGGRYLEVWSADVVQYPQSFATAKADGYFPAK